MKKTADLLDFNTNNGNIAEVIKKNITCEVVGEMSNGQKVWEDVETKEQYFCGRWSGYYYFYKE